MQLIVQEMRADICINKRVDKVSRLFKNTHTMATGNIVVFNQVTAQEHASIFIYTKLLFLHSTPQSTDQGSNGRAGSETAKIIPTTKHLF